MFTDEIISNAIKNIKINDVDDVVNKEKTFELESRPFPNPFDHNLTESENIIRLEMKKLIENEEYNNAIALWNLIHDPFAKNKIMNLLLVDYCITGNMACVTFVLSHRARADYKKNLPFVMACKHGNLNIVLNFIEEFNIKPNLNPNAYFEAVLAGQKEIITELIKREMDINMQNGKALRLCAEHGLTDMVNFLIELGADVHALNDRALVMAVINGHTDTVRVLLCHNANPDVSNGYCFEQAKSNNYKEILELLYSKKIEMENLKKNKFNFSNDDNDIDDEIDN